MILTREQAIELHRDMWNWMADEIEKIKKVVDIWKYKENYCKANGYIRVKVNEEMFDYYGITVIDNE